MANTGAILIVVIVFILLLGVGGFLLWWFRFRKKEDPDSGATGNGGTNGNGSSNGKGGPTGPTGSPPAGPTGPTGSPPAGPTGTTGPTGPVVPPPGTLTPIKGEFSITNQNFNKQPNPLGKEPFFLSVDLSSGTDEVASFTNDARPCTNYVFTQEESYTVPITGDDVRNAIIWKGDPTGNTLLCQRTFGFGAFSRQFATLEPLPAFKKPFGNNVPLGNCSWVYNSSDKTLCNIEPLSDGNRFCLNICDSCTGPQLGRAEMKPFDETDDQFKIEIIKPANNFDTSVCIRDT